MSRERDIQAMLTETSDIALSDPDPLERLRLLTLLRDETNALWYQQVGRIAYQARTATPKVTLDTLGDILGMRYHALTRFLSRYADDHGLPQVGVPRIDGEPRVLRDVRLPRLRRQQ